MRPLVPLAAAALVSFAVSGCSGMRSLDPRTWFAKEEAVPAARAREAPGADARLVSIASTTHGIVRVRESGDLFVVRVEIFGSKPGTLYRVVFHANGNCSSPNGFSAGAPFSPPGWKEAPSRLVPDVYTNSDGKAILTARVRGVRLGGEGGLDRRSVLVYEGASTEPPRPGVPNNVVACGVFEKATTLFAA